MHITCSAGPLHAFKGILGLHSLPMDKLWMSVVCIVSSNIHGLGS